jgi:hypothetical protein
MFEKKKRPGSTEKQSNPSTCHFEDAIVIDVRVRLTSFFLPRTHESDTEPMSAEHLPPRVVDFTRTSTHNVSYVLKNLTYSTSVLFSYSTGTAQTTSDG